MKRFEQRITNIEHRMPKQISEEELEEARNIFAELQERYPDCEFVGIKGPEDIARMKKPIPVVVLPRVLTIQEWNRRHGNSESSELDTEHNEIGGEI